MGIKSLVASEVAKALKLSPLQERLLGLYCEGMAYSNDFIIEMAREIKTLNAAELRHNISALSDRSAQ